MEFPQYDKKRKLLIDLLLEQSMRSGVTNAAVITLLAIVVWPAFPKPTIITWLLAGYLISLPRRFIFSSLKKSLKTGASYFRIEATLVVILFASGLFWGVTAWLYFIPDNVTIFVFVALSIIGMVSSALPVFSAMPYIWAIFAAAAFIPTASKLIYLGFWEVAGLAILSLFGLIPLSLNLGKQIEKSITLDLKNAELLKEVHAAKEKAEKANLAKSQFMAATSHDLRQPLHTQGILLEALSLRLREKENKDLLKKIVLSNNVLNSLFNSLLEVSQLDAGTMPVNIGHQPLTTICQQVVDEYQIIAQQKGLNLSLTGDDYIVITDPVLLNRILRNLISNAIKFTETGSIKIDIESNNDKVFINIIDTGIGIPESQQQHIFNEYYQLNNKARDRTKGIGLGLALVRRMCKLLKHDIELKSVEGTGTCFRLTLARGESSKILTKQKEVTAASIKDLKVLLIDDEEPILDAMTIMLRDWSCDPKAFLTLKSAEDYLDNNNYKPDVIISDYRLKEEVTGLDAIRSIWARLGEEVPALIISGDTDPDLLESINQQDFYMLHKPLKAAQLKKVLRVLIKK